MRKLVGRDYDEKLLFSTQHIWILNDSSLQYAAEQAGFTKMSVKCVQRYGISNLISWLSEKRPVGHVSHEITPKTLDSVFKSSLEDNGLSDYVLIYLEK